MILMGIIVTAAFKNNPFLVIYLYLNIENKVNFIKTLETVIFTFNILVKINY